MSVTDEMVRRAANSECACPAVVEPPTACVHDLALALLEARRRLATLGLGTPFPVHEVLRILADGVDHLEDAHDCDGDGWENRRRARDAARNIILGLEG